MENNNLEKLKAELIELSLLPEHIDLAFKHAKEKTLEGCMEWIMLY